MLIGSYRFYFKYHNYLCWLFVILLLEACLNAISCIIQHMLAMLQLH